MNESTPTAVESLFLSEKVERRIKFRVGRLARKYCLKRHDCQDLMQDFRLALLQAARKYDPDRGPAGALVTGTLNRRYRYLVRRLERQQAEGYDDAMFLSEIDDEFEETFVDESQENDLRRVELREDIETITASLSPKQQAICEAMKLYTPTEASRMLGINRGTIYRVLRDLRKRFVAAGYDSGSLK